LPLASSLQNTIAVDITSFRNASVSSGPISTNGQGITVLAGNNISFGSNDVNASRANGAGSAGFVILASGIANSGAGGSITAQNVNANAFGVAGANAGGAISLLAGGNILLSANVSSTGTTTGAGGAVLLSAGSTPVVSAASVTVGTQSASGGQINISGNYRYIQQVRGASGGSGGNSYSRCF